MKAFSRAHDKWVKAANQKLIDLAIATSDLIKDHRDIRRRLTTIEERLDLFDFKTTYKRNEDENPLIETDPAKVNLEQAMKEEK